MPTLSTVVVDQRGEGPVESEHERRYVSRDGMAIAGALGFGLMVFLFAWYRHHSYRSGTFDLAYFDQAVWLMAHGHAPFVTVIGRNIFADHFSPALVLFVPLYAIASTPVWLLAFQSAALGVGVVTLGPMLDELGVDGRWRVGFIFAYIASPALWNAGLFDFHMSTLAVPFLFAGITAALRDDVRRLALLSLVLLLLRDDLGLAVIAITLVGFSRSEHRRFRVGVAVLALAWVVIAGRFGQSVDSPALWRAHYGYLGSNGADALRHPLRTLARVVGEIWSPGNLQTITIWLLTLGFLPLLSPRRAALGLLWVIPLFASARFSSEIHLAFHHAAPVLPFLILGAASGIRRYRNRLFAFAGPPMIVTFATAALWAANPFARMIFDLRSPPPALASLALSHVAPGDRVTASDTLGPHLSHRVTLLPFPYPFMQGPLAGPLDESVTRVGAPFVARIDVVAIYIAANSQSSPTLQAFQRLAAVRDFRLVFNEAGLLVYQRVTPA